MDQAERAPVDTRAGLVNQIAALAVAAGFRVTLDTAVHKSVRACMLHRRLQRIEVKNTLRVLTSDVTPMLP